MAVIEERINSDKSKSYRVSIRIKDNECYKTFDSKEDAQLFVFYKENLIRNMNNFEVSNEEKITFEQVIELKIKTIVSSDKRAINSFTNCYERISQFFKDKKFINEWTYEEWLECAKNLSLSTVYRGAWSSKKSERNMSARTLRNVFSYASSAINHAISLGLNLENHALKVINTFIITLKDNE